MTTDRMLWKQQKPVNIACFSKVTSDSIKTPTNVQGTKICVRDREFFNCLFAGEWKSCNILKLAAFVLFGAFVLTIYEIKRFISLVNMSINPISKPGWSKRGKRKQKPAITVKSNDLSEIYFLKAPHWSLKNSMKEWPFFQQKRTFFIQNTKSVRTRQIS